MKIYFYLVLILISCHAKLEKTGSNGVHFNIVGKYDLQEFKTQSLHPELYGCDNLYKIEIDNSSEDDIFLFYRKSTNDITFEFKETLEKNDTIWIGLKFEIGYNQNDDFKHIEKKSKSFVYYKHAWGTPQYHETHIRVPFVYYKNKIIYPIDSIVTRGIEQIDTLFLSDRILPCCE
ncbi:MAG: hypothetical protein HC817_07920 [Saprospiraceae bacterium]|nr:hypothetical protein [Saprospiraceae bacterium]